MLSSGTWSLLGLELDAPRLDERAAGFNLTNERGVDGTIRLLRNVMGLWLLQECRREWGDPRYDELHAAGRGGARRRAAVRPRRRRLHRARATCRRGSPRRAARTGQAAPEGRGEVVRSILTSLACRYRVVLERLEQRHRPQRRRAST